MTEPILFVLDDDPGALAPLVGVLERRFGPDYRVLADHSPAAALARLHQARDRGEEVVLTIADHRMPEMTGLDWLARSRDVYSRAWRCLMVAYGDAAAYPLVRRALALGQVDSFLMKPRGNPEEKRVASAVGEGAIAPTRSRSI